MGVCKDPTVKKLNSLGYNMVKLPRVGIEPLDVLGREDKSMEKLGSITDVWTSTVAAPVPGAPVSVSSINGEKTESLDLAIGLKTLGDALAGLGAGISLPSLTLGFKNARKIQFRFVNVESTSVTPFALGRFLSVGSLDMANPFVSHYFGNDETQEYIIVDVLKSNSVSVTAQDSNGVDVAADVGALSGALSANVKVNTSSASSNEITFQSTGAKATFAFKIFEVVFENGKWMPQGVKADDSLSFGVSVGGESTETGEDGIVLSPGTSIRLR
ncbi:MAG: hypothetical protein ABJF23_04575 [Bryobacteraceae bacterium]